MCFNIILFYILGIGVESKMSKISKYMRIAFQIGATILFLIQAQVKFYNTVIFKMISIEI